jgi:hypothetical protein
MSEPGSTTASTTASRTEIEVVPGGPVLVRGADAVRGPDGAVHRTERPVVAVCACGLTQRAPWCDGTHKVARR